MKDPMARLFGAEGQVLIAQAFAALEGGEVVDLTHPDDKYVVDIYVVGRQPSSLADDSPGVMLGPQRVV